MRVRSAASLLPSIATALLLLSMVSAAPAGASFGFPSQGFDALLGNEGGSPDVRAGSHPFEMTTSFEFNTRKNALGRMFSDGDVRDLAVELPPGLIGNPSATPKCTAKEFHTPSLIHAGEGADCPGDTQVGVAVVTVALGFPSFTLEYGVYNLVPPPGAPAAFGFNPFGLAITLLPSVRTGSDNGITAGVSNVSQSVSLLSSKVTLWGVPGEASHDSERGKCLGEPGCTEPSSVGDTPFLRLPTSCPGTPLTTTIRADSWQEPGAPPVEASASDPPLIGCGSLDFSPSLSLTPQSQSANSPTAVSVDLKMPQNESPHGLGESDLRGATVALPNGLVVNPSAADGLQACSEAPEAAVGTEPARPGGQIELHSEAPVKCPDASKIGSVEVVSPLLEAPLEGAVYQAEPTHNPFKTLLAFYIVAEGPGVAVKLPGQVTADPLTGQLTTTVADAPQLPFSDFKLDFFGGPRAALRTAGCGTYAASALLTPWSGMPGVSPAIQSFKVGGNCGGGFAPSFRAGTASNQAGGFSPLSVTLARSDQDQELGQVSVLLPPGVLGMLSKVSLCGEPQAREGKCLAASQIGHVTVSAGAGPNPLYVPQAGRPPAPVFLTGPYGGAPFGLSIAVPAQAGPFDLGTVVVRAAIHIDPHTARITVVSDPLPRILQGIPLDVRTVNVAVDREGFTFNPTNCERFSVSGTIVSTLGARAEVSAPFQAANCAALPFKPKFTVSTQGQASKKLGASLDVKVTSGAGQANIGKAVVSLPKQLPSRLTTLQQACPEATFAANPATCPIGSNVGTATASTPVLNEPLSGPVYLVSHGGAAFPDLVVILQGQGIRLDLVGGTSIKKGVTTSSFASVPDAPIASFELKLPEGSHSALTTNLPAAAHGRLCGVKLLMPTTLTGQNGAVLKQSTNIALSGCATTVRPRRAARRASAGLSKGR